MAAVEARRAQCKPLEDKIVTVNRATATLTFPANLVPVAAMNPCPCGYFGDPVKERTCFPGMIHSYQKRIPSTPSARQAPALCWTSARSLPVG